MPNSYGSIEKLSGNRRKPFMVRKTVGWDENGKQIRKIIGYYESRTMALPIFDTCNKKSHTRSHKS